MSWTSLLLLAGGAYAFKVLGLVAIGDRPLPRLVTSCLDLLPAALVAALIAINTVAIGQRLVLDARVVGLVVAGVAVWRKAPFFVVVVLGAVSTAAWRRWVGV